MHHLIHEITWVELFLHNLLQFFQKIQISRISIDRMCLQIENSLIFKHCSQVGSIGFRSIEYDLFIFRSIKANLQLIKNLKEILRSSLPCSIGTRLIKIRKERKIKRIPQHVFFMFFFKNFFLSFPSFSRPIHTIQLLSFSWSKSSRVFLLESR